MDRMKSGLSRRDLLGGASVLAAGAVAASARAQEGAAAVDVAGKSVLITGTSSGFGLLASLHLAREGAKVIASMRNLEDGRRAEARALRTVAYDEKLDLSIIEIDVTDPDQVRRGVGEAEEIAGGALDVLVNNAGIAIAGPVEFHDEEALALQFQTNLFGYHRMARAVLPAMRRRGEGLLIQISSQLGRLVVPNIGMYSGTKFGLEAMFEAMAYELAPFGVDVSIVQPGGYPTKIWENGVRYFDALLARRDDAIEAAYEAHVDLARGLMTSPRETDPMDVPRAIAEIIAAPPGARPLRRPVHPDTRTSDAANAAMAQIQAGVLGAGPYAAWHKAVTG